MRLGVAIEDTWSFFHEIYADFQAHHDTRLFARRELKSGPFHTRINRKLLHKDMQSFMATNDVVFFEWASELLVVASHLPKQCAVVTRLHRFELYQWADRINWDAVDRIILVAEAKRREFLELYPTQAHKIDVISAGVDLTKFTYEPRPFRGNIGILCHLTPRKRVYELILTYAELLRQEPALRLHIAGGAGAEFRDYEDALHYLVRELALEDKVTFYGNVKDTWNWYQKIDILISNSYSEGLQVAPMEAMATGCYVLSHKWHGADELVPASQCYWTDSELQAKVLDYCALSDQSKKEKAHFMRELACERFDNSSKLPKIRDVINRAVQQRTPAGVEGKH